MAKPTNKPAGQDGRLDAFLVADFEAGGEKRSTWSKIGAAWPHADGRGYRIALNAIPTDGVIVLRQPDTKHA